MNLINKYIFTFFQSSSKNNFYFSKKCISPVVATALLLVVAVTSVVMFASWFDTFKDNLFVDVEQQGSISNLNIGVETLIGDTLYFKAGESTTISSVTIDGIECTGLNGTYSGMESLDVSSCISSVTNQVPEIIVITNRGVISKKIYLKNFQFSFSSCILDLVEVEHNNNHIFFNSTSVPFGNNCNFIYRTCNDGFFSGNSSYNYSNCFVELSSSLICNNDFDENGFISAACANYPMTITTFEGNLDPNDNDNKIQPNPDCLWNNNKSLCQDNYLIDGCGIGTILDITTNLCWQRDFNAGGSRNWLNAKNYCESLTLGSHSNWYLPSRLELNSLIDISRNSILIVGENLIFSNVIAENWYWTKTSSLVPSSSYARVLSFGTTINSNSLKTDLNNLVCVRRN